MRPEDRDEEQRDEAQSSKYESSTTHEVQCLLLFCFAPREVSLEPPWQRRCQGEVENLSKSLMHEVPAACLMLKCEHTWCVTQKDEVQQQSAVQRAQSGVQVKFDTPPRQVPALARAEVALG